MKVIILVGQRVRSGTNFIGSVLSRHPEVQTIPKGYSHGELNLFRSSKISEIFSEISTKSFGLKFEKEDEHKFYSNFGDLWIKLLIEKHNLDSNKVIFIKTPIISYFDLWLKSFPNAKFIFLSRDGRDNVISSTRASNDRRNWHTLKHKFKKRINFYSGRSFVKHTLDWKLTSRFFKSVPANHNIFKIKYEEVLRDDSTLGQLFKFLEINCDAPVLEHCKNAPVVGSSFGIDKKKMSKPNWKPINNKSQFKFSFKWRKWGWFKKSVFKFLAGKQLIELGYEKDNNW